jgi:hypothetical protein
MQLMQRRQMTIFISYAHEDAQVASEIAAALDSLGLRPWIDEREVQPGESFLKRMSEGLSAADYVVVLFSGASLRSHWVEREWMSSLARRDPIVVPVRLDTSEIPVLIRDLVWIDFVPSSEQGIEKLKSFFLRELETTGSAGERRTLSPQPSQTMPLWERSRHQLRLVTMSCSAAQHLGQMGELRKRADEILDPLGCLTLAPEVVGSLGQQRVRADCSVLNPRARVLLDLGEQRIAVHGDLERLDLVLVRHRHDDAVGLLDRLGDRFASAVDVHPQPEVSG